MKNGEEFHDVLWIPASGNSANQSLVFGLQNFQEILNSLRIAKNFFLVALAIRVEESKTNMMNAITKFDNTLYAMESGDENLNIIASPNQDISELIHE